MLGRIKQTDLSVPYRDGAYWYYSRTEEGKQYSIHCRKRGALDAPEEVLLDLNALAAGHSFMALGVLEISDDGRLMAYSTDNTGYREFTLLVKDLDTGATVLGPIAKCGATAWAADNRTLFLRPGGRRQALLPGLARRAGRRGGSWSTRRTTSASGSGSSAPGAAATSCSRARATPPRSCASSPPASPGLPGGCWRPGWPSAKSRPITWATDGCCGSTTPARASGWCAPPRTIPIRRAGKSCCPIATT